MSSKTEPVYDSDFMSKGSDPGATKLASLKSEAQTIKSEIEKIKPKLRDWEKSAREAAEKQYETAKDHIAGFYPLLSRAMDGVEEACANIPVVVDEKEEIPLRKVGAKTSRTAEHDFDTKRQRK